MANKGFNGTTVTFNGSGITGIVSVDASHEGEVDVTASGDAAHFFEAGIPAKSTKVEIIGNTTIAKGDTGALVVAWFDGGSLGSITSATVVSVGPTGQLDGNTLTTIEFAPFGG
jgi:hypothetical protein